MADSCVSLQELGAWRLQGPCYISVYPRAQRCAAQWALNKHLGREDKREEGRNGGREGGRRIRKEGEREGGMDKRRGKKGNVSSFSLLAICMALYHLNDIVCHLTFRTSPNTLF